VPGITDNVLNIVLIVLLISGLSIVYSNKVNKALNWWTLQTVFVSFLLIAEGFYNHELEVLVFGLMLLLVKAGIITLLLRRILKVSKTEWVGEIYLKRASSLVIAGGLTIIAYVVTKPLVTLPHIVIRNGLAVAIALFFCGLLLMMTRKVAIVQVLGILLIDNGIFLAGYFLTQGMPLLVEFGAVFDILVGIVIIGILSKQMLENYDSLNVDHMRSLKG
jgi:hydrogenase-4 component E